MVLPLMEGETLKVIYSYTLRRLKFVSAIITRVRIGKYED